MPFQAVPGTWHQQQTVYAPTATAQRGAPPYRTAPLGTPQAVPPTIVTNSSSSNNSTGSVGKGGMPNTARMTVTHGPPPQPSHDLRAEVTAMRQAMNSAILGMQAEVDRMRARCERIERRITHEHRAASDFQKRMISHIESLWRVTDGTREATKWCWAFTTPEAGGVVELRTRLAGQSGSATTSPAVSRQDGALPPRAPASPTVGRDADGARSTPQEKREQQQQQKDETRVIVRAAPPGTCFCVRYPMAQAPDSAGDNCVWIMTTLVVAANATMHPYWIKAYNIDRQHILLSDFTNVPPMMSPVSDVRRLQAHDESDESERVSDTDDSDDDTGVGTCYDRNAGSRNSLGDDDCDDDNDGDDQSSESGKEGEAADPWIRPAEDDPGACARARRMSPNGSGRGHNGSPDDGADPCDECHGSTIREPHLASPRTPVYTPSPLVRVGARPNSVMYSDDDDDDDDDDDVDEDGDTAKERGDLDGWTNNGPAVRSESDKDDSDSDDGRLYFTGSGHDNGSGRAREVPVSTKESPVQPATWHESDESDSRGSTKAVAVRLQQVKIEPL